MSIDPNITKQDLINLSILTEQRKNQRALKIENRNSKQTHDKKLAEIFTAITRRLEKLHESTQKLGEVFRRNSQIENQQEIVPVEFDSDNSEDDIRSNIRALPNIAKSSALMRDFTIVNEKS